MVSAEPKSETKLILGTASKRRIDLLSRFRLPFEAIPSDFDESSIPLDLPPDEYVARIAEGKSKTLCERHSTLPILTGDTSVYFNGSFYNKPKDEEDAFRMLSELQGNTHEVWSGLSLRQGDQLWRSTEVTKVTFCNLSDAQIQSYIDTFRPLDKAGSYAIQDASGLLVERMEGDFYNVVGLPIGKVIKLLSKVGINLWDYL